MDNSSPVSPGAARTRRAATVGLTVDPISRVLEVESVDGAANADGVAGVEGAGIVLGAVEAEAVGNAEEGVEAVLGDASGMALTAVPPQAVRTTAIQSTKLRLRMRGPYKVATAAQLRAIPSGLTGRICVMGMGTDPGLPGSLAPLSSFSHSERRVLSLKSRWRN